MRFLLAQLAVLVVSAGVVAQRYEVWRQHELPPVPNNEPIRIEPRHQRPDLVAPEDAERILKLLSLPHERRLKINHVDHALRLWGTDAAALDDASLSGHELREMLLDHRVFAESWGDETRPFLVPDTREVAGALSFRTGKGAPTASHVDHTLAGLAEVGTPLDFPVMTPRGELPLRNAFDQAFREFRLNQEEYEWSTLVFLHYLPHVRSWQTAEGQQITWGRLAHRLMRQRRVQGVCYGQHRLFALAALLRVDEQFALLQPQERAEIIDYLRDITARLVATQHADGSWDGSWPGREPEGESIAEPGPMGAQADRLLVTGHALEWWAYAPAECLPPDAVIASAARWLTEEMDGLSEAQRRKYYPFLTHVGRALALWSGVDPATVSASR